MLTSVKNFFSKLLPSSKPRSLKFYFNKEKTRKVKSGETSSKVAFKLEIGNNNNNDAP